MRTIVIALTLALGALLLAGCSNPEESSCNIKTPGIYVEFEAIEEGNTALGKATFWVGDAPGGTFLTLECGDEIAVNGTVLSHKSGTPHDWYESSIAPAESYDFVFTRPDEEPYASLIASMPPEVSISEPDGETIPRDEPFDILWDENGSGQIHLLIDGDCILDYPETLGDDITDNGQHTVNAGDIEPWESDENESCTAEIEMTRETGGTLDQSLKGTIEGKALGRSSFTTAPPAS
jgi:hypothetical protein